MGILLVAIVGVDQATGEIGIELYSTTPITVTQAGSLVNIGFHVVPGASVSSTAVQQVNRVMPNNEQFATEVDDAQGAFVLSPGKDYLMMVTGLGRARPGVSPRATSANRR